MTCCRECPFVERASSIPTPSSTEAIIAARRRISSCVPACTAREERANVRCARSSNTSRHAGFCLHHFLGRQHVRPRREDSIRGTGRGGARRACSRPCWSRSMVPSCFWTSGCTALWARKSEEWRSRLRNESHSALVEQVGDVALHRRCSRHFRRAPGRRAGPAPGSSPSGRSPDAGRRRCPCATCRCARSRSRGAAAPGSSWPADGSPPRARRCR